ncbi:MAG: SAV_6107 family HEPN domain-containing protein [Nostocoides sp.]
MDLITDAEAALIEASRARIARDRYVTALRAALRAATALIAARRASSVGRPEGRSSGPDGPAADTSALGSPPSVWELLSATAPEFTEWADFFAFSAARRVHLESPSASISARSADDLVRAAQTFVDLVSDALGAPRAMHDGRLAPLSH